MLYTIILPCIEWNFTRLSLIVLDHGVLKESSQRLCGIRLWRCLVACFGYIWWESWNVSWEKSKLNIYFKERGIAIDKCSSCLGSGIVCPLDQLINQKMLLYKIMLQIMMSSIITKSGWKVETSEAQNHVGAYLSLYKKWIHINDYSLLL